MRGAIPILRVGPNLLTTVHVELDECKQLAEEREKEDGTAENAIDGQTANMWHTEWSGASPNHPHELILNLGQSQTISGFRYVPRQSEGAGRIKDYRVYVGDNLVTPLGN